jgi:hypothetical protein
MSAKSTLLILMMCLSPLIAMGGDSGTGGIGSPVKISLEDFAVVRDAMNFGETFHHDELDIELKPIYEFFFDNTAAVSAHNVTTGETVLLIKVNE